MIDKKVVKKILGGILRKNKQTFFDRQIMHARRDWNIGLLVGVFVIIGFSYWTYQTYTYYRELSPNRTAEIDSETVYREALVKTVLEDFATRRKVYEDIKSELILERRTERVLTEVKSEGSNEANNSEDEDTSVVPESDEISPVILGN